jgi:predicted cobalt transporter CbtA
MKHWSDKLALILTTLWVGALWSLGFIAVQVLFNVLAHDKQMAGMLAGRMFTVVSYVGITCAAYLIVYRLLQTGFSAFKQGFFWALLIMLLLTLAGEFGIQPILASLKAQALPADVMQSVFANRFRAWHGVASVAYLIECLLGLVLIFKLR